MLALLGLVAVAAASFPEEFRNATHIASVFADLDAPKFLPARTHAAAPALDAVVEFLRGDAVDVRGHGGAPLPANLDPGAALAGDARVSFVARLEKFAAGASSNALKTLGLPGAVADYDAGDTVHVYASAPGASALANHTDTADVLVHQVLGRKTWFVCASAADESPKLGTCATYGDDEVEPFLDSCSTLTLGPGDSLLLPRRSLHSARAYDDAPSAPGPEKGANFPTSRAPISAVFYSFWLIFGRAIIARSGLEAWMLFFGTRARGTLTLKRR